MDKSSAHLAIDHTWFFPSSSSSFFFLDFWTIFKVFIEFGINIMLLLFYVLLLWL